MPLQRKRLKKGAETLQTGQETTTFSVKHTPSKKTVASSASSEPTMSLPDKYQATADELDVDLATVMRTLPRGEVSIESVYVSEQFHSLKVRCTLEQTFPDFTPRTTRKEYENLVARTKYIVKETLNQLREETGL